MFEHMLRLHLHFQSEYSALKRGNAPLFRQAVILPIHVSNKKQRSENDQFNHGDLRLKRNAGSEGEAGIRAVDLHRAIHLRNQLCGEGELCRFWLQRACFKLTL